METILKKDYPWSESGKELLKEWEILIDKYGGIEKTASLIETESLKIFKPSINYWNYTEELWLKKNYHKFSSKYMASRLNKTKEAVNQKIIVLLKRGDIKRKPNNTLTIDRYNNKQKQT